MYSRKPEPVPLDVTGASETRADTHIVNLQQAVDTLDYDEMVALAGMFNRWAFTEESLTPELSTRLVQLSADYESIAEYVGPDWTARDPGSNADAIQCAARIEKRGQQRRGRVWRTR